MKKNCITMILIILLYTACINTHTDIYYRIREISSKYELNYYNKDSVISSLSKDIWIKVYFKEYEGKYGAIVIGMEFSKNDTEKKSVVELLDDIKIIKNGKDISVLEIKKEVYEDNGVKRTYFTLILSEELKGKVILDCGKVKVGNRIFKLPLMYLQRYRITYSNTLVEALLSESGEDIEFYHSEGWIEE